MTWPRTADLRLVGVRLVVADDRAGALAAVGLGPGPARAAILGLVRLLPHGDTVKPRLIWLFGQSFAYAALVPALGVLAEIVAVFAAARSRTRGCSRSPSSRIGRPDDPPRRSTTPTRRGSGRSRAWCCLLLAVVATVPSVVALVLLKTSLWQAALRPSLDRTDVVRRRRRRPARRRPPLRARPRRVRRTIAICRGTAFGVAHAHYLLWGTALFALLGGLVYWWPKIFGRLLGTRLTRGAAVLLFVGFNLHVLRPVPARRPGPGSGRIVVQRARQHVRVQHDLDDRGSATRRSGSCSSCSRWSRAHNGRRAGNDPWHGDTLEWYTTSPPPPHNFDSLPRSTSARPLADLRRHAAGAQCSLRDRPDRGRVSPGPLLRLTIAAAAVATAAVVASATLDTGRGHWAAALVALPLLVAAVIIARIAYPRLLVADRRLRSRSCSSRRDRRAGRARATTRAGRSRSTSPRPARRSPRRSSRSSSRSAASRSRSVPWRDYVTLTKPRIMSLLLLTGAAGMFVGAEGWPGRLGVPRRRWSGSRSPAAARAPSTT